MAAHLYGRDKVYNIVASSVRNLFLLFPFIYIMYLDNAIRFNNVLAYDFLGTKPPFSGEVPPLLSIQSPTQDLKKPRTVPRNDAQVDKSAQETILSPKVAYR
jgi:hypothetical protein